MRHRDRNPSLALFIRELEMKVMAPPADAAPPGGAPAEPTSDDQGAEPQPAPPVTRGSR